MGTYVYSLRKKHVEAKLEGIYPIDVIAYQYAYKESYCRKGEYGYAEQQRMAGRVYSLARKAFEHYIITEVQKINEYYRKDWELSFYATERGAEVDCIIESPKRGTLALEIKSTEAPASVHCRGLRSFKETVPQAELILACRTSMKIKIGDVTVLPWQGALDYLLKEC